ncbi:MAG: PfkB family carbohydrate kinase [Candidatus Riflebacteria bacterium]|nr:PfkB family carbohydrate kinase [Candidatus Riflebacteria bacterium]
MKVTRYNDAIMIITVTPNALLEYQIESDISFAGGHRLDEIPFTVGGKGINVARMLRNLGRPALALTFVGGNNGEKIKEKLKYQGIFGGFIETEAETRVGISLLENNGEKHRWWIEEGRALQEAEIQKMIKLLQEESKNAAFIAFSGSVPGHKNQDLYWRLIESIRDSNSEIYVDARDKALVDACKVGGFFLKHNREETIKTFNKDPFDSNVCIDYFKLLEKCKIWGALITDGKNNALLWDGKSVYIFEPANVKEVSSVGCGDATLAGFIYARKLGMSLVESAVVGLASGAADARHAGPCEADWQEVQELMAQIKASKII